MRNRQLARVVRVAGLAALVCAPLAAQSDHHGAVADQNGDLGDLTFPNSGSRAAQPQFIRGVLLLHSFQYAQAAEAFRRAQQADPGFAMAYWGEAMAYNQTGWGEQDCASANGALSRLGPTPEAQLARAPTAREKAYLAAVQTLCGDGSTQDRVAAYARAMEHVATAYAEDIEARAFYASALLALPGRDEATRIRAAAIAEEVYAANPRHPGAAHYMLHAYDDPVHAPLGLRAAAAYAKLAPGSAHALHMPAHIFFRLGKWDASIDANVRSLAAERRVGRVGTHAMHWLVYAYLQQGRRDEAAALLRTLEEEMRKPQVGRTVRYAKAQICAVWVIETGSDRDAPCDGDIDRSGIVSILTFVEYDLARGLAALRRNDLAGASAASRRIRDMLTHGRSLVSPNAAASRIDQVTEKDIALGSLMSLELEAALLFAEGRQEEALRRAAEAVAMEDAATFRVEPPSVPKPPRELLAELLMAAGRVDEARQRYEAALERNPGRAHTLVGLLRALERTGDATRAADIRERLRQQWRTGEWPAPGPR
jgi:tetratricopeptide (TPR) repeat protein